MGTTLIAVERSTRPLPRSLSFEDSAGEMAIPTKYEFNL
jgi:hypothetical protein